MFHFFVMLGTALVIVEAIMLLFWILYLAYRNVSLIDIGWGLGFISAAFVYFLLGEGFIWRKILILTIVSIWAMRLIYHFAERFSPDREDPRYQLALNRLPLSESPNLQVLMLYTFQGILITFLSLPFALMSQNTLPYFTTFEVFGLLIWMGGLIGETVADQQLTQFKKNPLHANQVLDTGLWKYSRHPNYFFEWIIWIGYCIMALPAPFGWVSIFAPFLVLYLLVKVSGIPLTEAEALESKGDAYREYQSRTSAFIPWFSWGKHIKENKK